MGYALETQFHAKPHVQTAQVVERWFWPCTCVLVQKNSCNLSLEPSQKHDDPSCGSLYRLLPETT